MFNLNLNIFSSAMDKVIEHEALCLFFTILQYHLIFETWQINMFFLSSNQSSGYQTIEYVLMDKTFSGTSSYKWIWQYHHMRGRSNGCCKIQSCCSWAQRPGSWRGIHLFFINHLQWNLLLSFIVVGFILEPVKPLQLLPRLIPGPIAIMVCIVMPWEENKCIFRISERWILKKEIKGMKIDEN